MAAAFPALVSASGNPIKAQQGESCNVVHVSKDFAGTAIPKANLDTLTVTLWNIADGSIINSRNAQDVIDTNDGTVETDGTLTLRLQAADNTIVDTTLAVGAEERHGLRITWGWNDGTDDRVGVDVMEFNVVKMP